jgi:hypothetical protein
MPETMAPRKPVIAASANREPERISTDLCAVTPLLEQRHNFENLF